MARPYQVRSFDSLLKSRIKSSQMRQRIYKNLLTQLVQDERVVTTLTKCKDLSRVAERMIDLAKKGDEATVYTWINRKEMVPKVFGELVDRYTPLSDSYTTVYKLPPRKFDSAQMGVVEFKGNKLPQILVTNEQIQDSESAQQPNEQPPSINIPWKGTPV